MLLAAFLALAATAPGAAQAVTFSGPTSFASGSFSVSVAVGDFNGDSDPDLAVANRDSDDVSVLLGGTGGSFGPATNFPVGDGPRSVAVGDFNADSDPDLATAHEFSHDVSVLLGGTGGSFGPAASFAAAGSSVAVGDFNLDGDPDLATNVSVLLGGPEGSFGPATNFAAGSSPVSVAVGDFNLDSDLDLAVANAGSDDVSVLLGGPGGSFGPATNFPVGDAPRSVAVGDFNLDSDPDLAVANLDSFGPNDISVLLGGPGGSFGPATNFAAGDGPISVAVGDFNGDSDPDLAVANNGSFNVSVLLGGAGGSFGAATSFPAGIFPEAVAVGDFDADSASDLAIANGDSAGVSVLLNTTVVNRPPDCYGVTATPSLLWPPNHKLRLVNLSGATDPEGDAVTLTVTGVTQDEPLNGLGDGDTSPDAKAGTLSNNIFLRAERSGSGNGRVYRVSFTGSDGEGGSCAGTVTVGVPKNMGAGSTPADSPPPSHNSFGP